MLIKIMIIAFVPLVFCCAEDEKMREVERKRSLTCVPLDVVQAIGDCAYTARIIHNANKSSGWPFGNIVENAFSLAQIANSIRRIWAIIQRVWTLRKPLNWF